MNEKKSVRKVVIVKKEIRTPEGAAGFRQKQVRKDSQGIRQGQESGHEKPPHGEQQEQVLQGKEDDARFFLDVKVVLFHAQAIEKALKPNNF